MGTTLPNTLIGNKKKRKPERGERGIVKVTLVDNFGNEPLTLTFGLVLFIVFSLGPRKTRDSHHMQMKENLKQGGGGGRS